MSNIYESYNLFLEPFYDNDITYYHILTINKEPQGPLVNYIKLMPIKKVSTKINIANQNYCSLYKPSKLDVALEHAPFTVNTFSSFSSSSSVSSLLKAIGFDQQSMDSIPNFSFFWYKNSAFFLLKCGLIEVSNGFIVSTNTIDALFLFVLKLLVFVVLVVSFFVSSSSLFSSSSKSSSSSFVSLRWILRHSCTKWAKRNAVGLSFTDTRWTCEEKGKGEEETEFDVFVAEIRMFKASFIMFFVFFLEKCSVEFLRRKATVQHVFTIIQE